MFCVELTSFDEVIIKQGRGDILWENSFKNCAAFQAKIQTDTKQGFNSATAPPTLHEPSLPKAYASPTKAPFLGGQEAARAGSLQESKFCLLLQHETP